ncbi:Major Facilitator Superfamily protein [Alternaria alternata]|nr:Major Facilitator Superfamily protein [Alternaria alternata]
MLLMGAVATFPLFVPPFLLPLYAASLGLSGQTGAAILAAWNFASAVGRIVMGFGADKVLGPVNSMILSLLLVSLSALALWPFASNLGLIIFFAIVNGVGSGGFFSLMPVVVGAVFGDDITTVMSMLNTSWFFGYFMVGSWNPLSRSDGTSLMLTLVQGAPIAGYLLDAYGGTGAGLAAYRPAIFYAGSLTLASSGLLLSVRLMITQNLSAKV